MNTDDPKELYGLVGYPVRHSHSPAMQVAAFAHYGRRASYELFEVAPEGLDAFLKKGVFEKRLRGFNVTVPHKGKAAQYIDGPIFSHGVRMLPVVNTVRVESGGRLVGFNTDAAGFARDLKEKGQQVHGRKVALIGAGGGAQAVAAALAQAGPQSLSVTDIDQERAGRLAQALGELYPKVRVRAVETIVGLKIEEADILVNATPVGMKEPDPLLVSPQLLHPGLFVYDLIYNPAETKLIAAARRAGCRAANGLGMLLHQGCLAFEHWTGRDAPVETMRRALEGALDGRNGR